MAEPQDYEFHIDAYTPETMPMVRLLRYLNDLAILLGNQPSVHLIAIEEGSVKPRLRVDGPDVPKVEERIRAVRQSDAPPEAMRAFRSIDDRLARDNARGSIVAKGSKVIEFPGRDRLREVQPFSQPGSLDGIVMAVGGKDHPPTVHLQDETRSYICRARRDLVRRIAPHIYENPIRVHGLGRWERNQVGEWALIRFTIHDFEELKDTALNDLIARIRASGLSRWGQIDDPLGDLHKIRHGE